MALRNYDTVVQVVVSWVNDVVTECGYPNNSPDR